MRKAAIGIALLAAFLVSMTGCADTKRQAAEEAVVSGTAATSEVMENREPEESRTVSFSDGKESSEEAPAKAGTEPPAAETGQAAAETITPAAESQNTESQSPPPAEESRSPQTEPAKADEAEPPSAPQPEPAEEIPAEAPATAPSKEAPAEESTPQPAEEPAAFDIQTWIDHAKEYAESVGLNLSPDATACWDNPITAGSHSLYLERDIESRLNRYSRDGEITDVWIWAEERSDGSYDLYIGYA